jgi:hypothetical protein
VNRITFTVVAWFGRYRANVFVDGHPVVKAFFDSEADAVNWCQDRRAELAQEVRG